MGVSETVPPEKSSSADQVLPLWSIYGAVPPLLIRYDVGSVGVGVGAGVGGEEPTVCVTSTKSSALDAKCFTPLGAEIRRAPLVTVTLTVHSAQRCLLDAVYFNVVPSTFTTGSPEGTAGSPRPRCTW